jgi:hypothetical protein
MDQFQIQCQFMRNKFSRPCGLWAMDLLDLKLIHLIREFSTILCLYVNHLVNPRKVSSAESLAADSPTFEARILTRP